MALELSEEGHAMMGYNSMSENPSDTENNNNNNNLKSEKNILNEKEAAVQYSSNSKGIIAQCLVTGAVLLVATGGGIPIGYSAVLLPQLSEENSTLHVDRETGSWIAAVHSLATPIGSLLSGPLLDAIGRRGCLQLSSIPLCIGWLIIGFSRNVTSILAGRVICGVSVGFMAVPAQVLVGETAYPGLRGFLVVGSFAAYCAGILLVYALGASFNWDVVAFSSIILPIAAFIALCLIPESPAWLIRRKKVEKAKKALLWLRGGNIEQMLTEIELLDASIKADLARKPVNTSFKEKVSSALSTIRDPGVLKPLIIINVFNALQLSCGTYIIVFYAVDMVKDMGNGSVDNYLAAVVTAVIRFIFSLVSCVLLLKMGRRTLGIISALGTSLASLILAGYLTARKEGSSVDVYVLAVCLIFYVGANTLGLLTLPGLMAGELMPLRARGIGGGCIFFVFNLLLFFMTKCFPWLNSQIGTTGIFTIFGVCALLEGIFIYLALPETKDRTLQEIEEYFQQSNFLWINRTRPKRKDTHVPMRPEFECLMSLPECK
ncbi:PREDICTED: facilitated trehalose transporter Tret1-2 homolog [Wasmannia auropunctata]|uniref:facilitated trehalose transporter Tret1-2 homolog n=1 Tax=Wasmannia auropunctata TaxID=64793 RepID=UPI0005EF4DC2|nr:PREDICTED: facilitated trehalose transporter Tret1-2 homolog [Wasmannia auropunctata]XP_011690697.1 PREDICTED: facilitated trehalose transporter Tret1-2 homolog [Wasmannia auropunctata]XP_011690698.1 PREDICTED: facilitated trehalose transporter Tret1-2 homolog [Wasmannia auropunctata]XP_011690699.1 PREDICTED: facilitated trehalose transporter Tret1-2 homolog [Wasmannia auropunctata]XP_011690700.1 PREDICTED: facilitated trehalose transporter Tret1-2 homolog [Wasmannia auropunctata]XP_0116907